MKRTQRVNFAPVTFDEQLLYITVRLEGLNKAGRISAGTGFIFNVPVDCGKNYVPVLITNRHVIEGLVRLNFHIHYALSEKAVPDGHLPVTISGASETYWEIHPDPSIDLAAINALSVCKALPTPQHRPFWRGIGADLVPTEEIVKNMVAVQSVLMAGYPNGLWDEHNNYPILRSGKTASHPAIDFNGDPHRLVDIAVFPGSSGSPVFIHEQSRTYNRAQNQFTIGNNFTIFLGVLFGGGKLTKQGDITLNPVPTVDGTFFTSEWIDIGYLLKAEVVRDFAFDLVKKWGHTVQMGNEN